VNPIFALSSSYPIAVHLVRTVKRIPTKIMEQKRNRTGFEK